MSVKTQVSQGYLYGLMGEHAWKKHKNICDVLITGAGKEGSIGEKIARTLKKHNVTYFSDADVREDFYGNFSLYDTLIMCHGVTHLDWFENAPIEKVKEIFDVNIFGTYNMAREFVNQTIHLEWRKRIFIIGSMAHRAVLNGSSAYCASKAAVAHLARCMAWELTPKGYDVFCIHPSNTSGTPMTEETIKGLMRYRKLGRDEAESYWNDSPIRSEILTTSEIANLIKFIMKKNSAYLSGSQIELSGGQR